MQFNCLAFPLTSYKTIKPLNFFFPIDKCSGMNVFIKIESVIKLVCSLYFLYLIAQPANSPERSNTWPYCVGCIGNDSLPIKTHLLYLFHRFVHQKKRINICEVPTTANDYTA